MVSKVEFDQAFPHDRNGDDAHGSLLEGGEKILGGSVEKLLEITCQAFLVVSVASSAPLGVSIAKKPVIEGRVRDHHDNAGYLVVLIAIE